MTVYSFDVNRIDGTAESLEKYKGNLLIIVNTASKCGLAPQLEGLEELYREFKDDGLTVLGFPCNQFLGQEPLDGKEITEFCQLNYDVTFPLYEKVKVNGKDAHPLYKYLKEQTKNKVIKWNYTKFLIDREGNVFKRYAPQTDPKKMKDDIQSLV